jgi:hypothetical protein
VDTFCADLLAGADENCTLIFHWRAGKSTCSGRTFREYLLMQKTLLNFADDLAPFARRMVSFLNHKSRITHHA